MDNEPDKPPVLTITALICVAAIGLYVGAYLSLVEPVHSPAMSFWTMGMSDVEATTATSYRTSRVPQNWLKRLFAPANSIDRKLRRNKWPAPAPTDNAPSLKI